MQRAKCPPNPPAPAPAFFPSFFNINITVCRGSNDIRELTQFSTQLDMLIEKPRFKAEFTLVQMVGQCKMAELGQCHFQAIP